MEKQFSYRLLYAIPPENLSELHLREDSEEFEWEEPTTWLLAKQLLTALSRIAQADPGDRTTRTTEQVIS